MLPADHQQFQLAKPGPSETAEVFPVPKNTSFPFRLQLKWAKRKPGEFRSDGGLGFSDPSQSAKQRNPVHSNQQTQRSSVGKQDRKLNRESGKIKYSGLPLGLQSQQKQRLESGEKEKTSWRGLSDSDLQESEEVLEED